MTEQELYKLQFPIGKFKKPELITPTFIETWIADIEAFPNRLEAVTNQISETELNYKYRPNGWTVKQVIHHCADSHINSITRFKLAITEDTPIIRPYMENRFAKLIDYKQDIDSALLILKGVHAKLGILLKSFSSADLKREFIHPEHNKHFSLEEAVGVYAWHSNHHFAHIKQGLASSGKYN